MALSVLDRMLSDPSVVQVDQGNLPSFLNSGSPLSAVLFTGDKNRKREAHDVAVVIRELRQFYGDNLQVGIVTQESERALMPVFGILRLPSLVFLRDGGVLDVVPAIQDWSVYAEKARGYLAGGGTPLPVKLAA